MSISATAYYSFVTPDGSVIERGLTSSNVINPNPSGTGVVLPEQALTLQYGTITPAADANTPVLLQSAVLSHGNTMIDNSITSTGGNLDLSPILNGVLNTVSLTTSNLIGDVLGSPATQYIENINIPTVVVSTAFVPNMRLDSGFDYLGQNAYPPPVLPPLFSISTTEIVFDLSTPSATYPIWTAGDRLLVTVNFLFKNITASGQTSFSLEYTTDVNPNPLWVNMGILYTYGTLNAQRNMRANYVYVVDAPVTPVRIHIIPTTAGLGTNFITGGYYSLTCFNLLNA